MTEIPKCHKNTHDKWVKSGKTLRVDYLTGSNVWIECRNGIEWDKNTEYRITKLIKS